MSSLNCGSAHSPWARRGRGRGRENRHLDILTHARLCHRTQSPHRTVCVGKALKSIFKSLVKPKVIVVPSFSTVHSFILLPSLPTLLCTYNSALHTTSVVSFCLTYRFLIPFSLFSHLTVGTHRVSRTRLQRAYTLFIHSFIH